MLRSGLHHRTKLRSCLGAERPTTCCVPRCTTSCRVIPVLAIFSFRPRPTPRDHSAALCVIFEARWMICRTSERGRSVGSTNFYTARRGAMSQGGLREATLRSRY